MVKICVVGAGVIGLSSALRIIELHPEAEVVVIADKFSPGTTSDVSGGFWEPHLLGDTPQEKIRKWSSKTFEHMSWLANTDCAKYTGTCMVSGYQMSSDPNTEAPFWKDQVKNFRVLSQDEMKQYEDMKFGFFYTTVKLESQMYLQWLMKRVQRLGGRLKKQRINTFEELADGNYAVIINCTGVGARQLANDSSVQPVRGQVIRVQAPWIKQFSIFIGKDELSYILPSSNYVVLGGVEHHGDWNTEVSTSDKKLIWDNCTKYLPSLTEAVIDSDCVGLRPARPSVRLEIEHIDVKGKIMPVIHNYGHGGAGVTLHWGCAEEVSHLITDLLRQDKTMLKSKTELAKL
ncbi:D-aspartate oxidase-like isoform X2 [Mercenaria mercenaria]|uniref:D-aspartate oxidase-like isoform X2 n=1 Tax=Mercenaria mercenaria TaxID=6596 RepID=UPI00234EFCDD|nr:D-aspartate oxidase-like isoform X2 [Mercenaria mercenaria]